MAKNKILTPYATKVTDSDDVEITDSNPFPVKVISDTLKTDYALQDTEEVLNITYVGKENDEGVWLLFRVVETNGSNVIRYASEINNPTYTTYDTAWSARVGLTYSKINEVQ